MKRSRRKAQTLGSLLLSGLASRGRRRARPVSARPKKRRGGGPLLFGPVGVAESETETETESEAETDQLPVSVPVSVSASVPVSDSAPAPFPALKTPELTRPDGKLKQSIEAFLLDQRSPHTRKAYGKDLKRFVQYLHSRKFDLGIETLGRSVLIAYKESLLSEGLEHTTVDRHLASLRSFFKWLVDDGVLSRSPAEGVRFLNPKRLSTTLGFSDEEVKKVLSVPDLHTRTGALHYAVLMVLFYCGLR